ncbi:uncharacterized protein [Drosophila pseudoobscura]|uniref:Uncharacterized protein n=1 Tax=Drosophila pseudoobscura pseudoobscura TaxID=46245 RepID=A0A6I8VZU9_DROPS|nr:uncharacterized protein LOC26533135 [Drosophila pseudoobscura]
MPRSPSLTAPAGRVAIFNIIYKGLHPSGLPDGLWQPLGFLLWAIALIPLLFHRGSLQQGSNRRRKCWFTPMGNVSNHPIHIKRWAAASRRRTYPPYALGQTESFTISPARQSPIKALPRLIRDRPRSIPARPNLTSYRHPSTWPSTTRTLTMVTKRKATRDARL